MNKKLIPFSLIFFILITILVFYFKFKKEDKLSEIKSDKSEEIFHNSNIIKDVNYVAKDSKGNIYNLMASEGIVDQKENNYIFLTNVKGTINFKDYNLIEISSDFGKYNVNNYDTIFSKNVMITYLDNTIKGEYLDFSWDRNLMIISKNVILENNKSSLKSDVIEVDISTKKIKIFMYEENKKVSIKTLN